MTVKQKVEDLLSKKYDIAMWDCYNNELNSEEYILEQKVTNSIIVVDEILDLMISSFKWDTESNGNIYFWQEVKEQLENKL